MPGSGRSSGLVTGRRKGPCPAGRNGRAGAPPKAALARPWTLGRWSFAAATYSAPESTSWPFPDPTSTPLFHLPALPGHPNFPNKLLRNFISLSRSPKPLSLVVQKPPPGLPGGGGCLIVTGNLALGNCGRIYRSSKCGPYNNRRGMVFEVYALVNFC